MYLSSYQGEVREDAVELVVSKALVGCLGPLGGDANSNATTTIFIKVKQWERRICGN